MKPNNTPAHAQEMLRRQRLRPPQTLTIAITGVCNLRCRHCWVEAGEASSAPHVPVQTLRRLLGEFAALAGSGVRLTGGEPLCHPGWLEIMRLCRALGFESLVLQTNAMLLTDAHAFALGALDFAGLSVQVSLDGAGAPSHDLVRGEGAFDLAVAGIRRLVGAGLGRRLTIAFTEMAHNLEEIPTLLELATELGVASVVTGSLVTGGRAGRGSPLAPPSRDQYLGLIDRYANDTRFRTRYDAIATVAALEWLRGDAPRGECCTFAENPYLTPDGRLYPCLLCHTHAYAVSGTFGKGLPSAFAEAAPLWASLLRISRSRAEALTACGDCPARLTCAGGCMGRAWGSCGDLLAADDRCGLRRAAYQLANPDRSVP
ncbi:MAG TPA: radical SAM protein [Geobacteraceae bacterium]